MKFCQTKLKKGNTTNFINHLKGKHSLLFSELKALEAGDKVGLSKFIKNESLEDTTRDVNHSQNAVKVTTIPEIVMRKAQFDG